VLPQLWVKKVITRHSGERADFPGTGGEFARHVLDEMKLDHVKVEETDLGDHYDPEAKVVRLSPQHLNGRSLSAVVIAAHEAGHAMQDATGYPPLQARTRLAKQAIRAEKVGAVVMLAAPIVMALAKAPYLLVLEVFAGVMLLALSIRPSLGAPNQRTGAGAEPDAGTDSIAGPAASAPPVPTVDPAADEQG